MRITKKKSQACRINQKGSGLVAQKKTTRPIATSPRIVSQIDLIKMAKNGDSKANEEMLKRLSSRSDYEQEHSRE